MATQLESLTFGIEIEAIVPVDAVRAAGIVQGGYHRGIQIPNFPQGWNAQSDSSIQTEAGFVAIEFVSPILKGEDSLRQVAEVCEKLNAMGAKVNKSCGFHVHVGAAGMDAAALARLICFVSYHERAFYAVSGTKSRESGSYCRSIKTTLRKAAKGYTPQTANEVERDGYSRYSVLNLTNVAFSNTYGRKGTVEFRCFSGTTSFVKASAWIQICLATVAKAIDSKRSTAWDCNASPDRKVTAGKGEGGRATFRLLEALAWQDPRPGQTALAITANVKELKKELFRLADKYDGNNAE